MCEQNPGVVFFQPNDIMSGLSQR